MIPGLVFIVQLFFLVQTFLRPNLLISKICLKLDVCRARRLLYRSIVDLWQSCWSCWELMMMVLLGSLLVDGSHLLASQLNLIFSSISERLWIFILSLVSFVLGRGDELRWLLLLLLRLQLLSFLCCLCFGCSYLSWGCLGAKCFYRLLGLV